MARGYGCLGIFSYTTDFLLYSDPAADYVPRGTRHTLPSSDPPTSSIIDEPEAPPLPPPPTGSQYRNQPLHRDFHKGDDTSNK